MGMTYSKIERSFWETDEARELTPEEKYFWMYLQTNANVNTLGCYAFRMRKAVDETGYNKDTLEKLLDIMIQRGMILYDATTREIFLLHWGKTNWNRQTATLRAMKADLKEIRSEMIKFKINTQLEKSGIFTKEGENDKVSEENDKAENAEISAKTANKENNSEQMRTIGNNQGGEGEGEGEGEKKKEKEKILKSDSEAFAAFWEAYPNKKNKAVAVKRWDSLRVTAGLYEKIMAGLAKAKHSMEWAERGGKYIPYPSTWLNAEGWENEYRPLAPEQPTPPPTTSGNDALANRRGLAGG